MKNDLRSWIYLSSLNIHILKLNFMIKNDVMLVSVQFLLFICFSHRFYAFPLGTAPLGIASLIRILSRSYYL